MAGKPQPVIPRFWSKVAIPVLPQGEFLPSDCWEWIAGRTTAGYGTFAPGREKRTYAHRFSYELLVGPIPEGLHIDHLCRNRGCVNPDHLEPVTNRENGRRGMAAMVGRARCAAITHCPQGHAYTKENTYVDKRRCRQCRECSRARNRERRMRIRGGAGNG